MERVLSRVKKLIGSIPVDSDRDKVTLCKELLNIEGGELSESGYYELYQSFSQSSKHRYMDIIFRTMKLPDDLVKDCLVYGENLRVNRDYVIGKIKRVYSVSELRDKICFFIEEESFRSFPGSVYECYNLKTIRDRWDAIKKYDIKILKVSVSPEDIVYASMVEGYFFGFCNYEILGKVSTPFRKL